MQLMRTRAKSARAASSVIPRPNNLEALRFVFAAQVAVVHTLYFLHGYEIEPLKYVPGVPAFFFVSGLLIYASHEHSLDISDFVRNRVLRLFPALIAVTIGGLVVVVVGLGIRESVGSLRDIVLWFLSQITLGQAYTPEFFRPVGVGLINPSLWTITVELLFYASVPVVAAMQHRWRHAVTCLAITSFAVSVIGPHVLSERAYGRVLLTPLPWGWMFLAGVLAYLHLDRVIALARFWPVAMVGMALCTRTQGPAELFASTSARQGAVYFALYSLVILGLAFTVRLPQARADLSYGLYIWHMPVVNLVIIVGVASAAVAFPLALALAAASWYAVERPSLRRKRRALKTY